MNALATAIGRLALGPARTFHHLSVFPLCRDGVAPRSYVTLDEALARDGVRITEVSELGSVPELRLTNTLAVPVLLLDGEELIGAKQNRVLNLSVLAPALATITIPVSCVERGRWHDQHRHFETSDRAQYAAGRAARAASVAASLARDGTRRSDQGAVWADIDAKATRMRVRSRTDAMAALYESSQVTLDAYVKAFTPEPTQLGAVFAIDGRVTGLDLFDHPDSLQRLLPKLVRSQALDAIERPPGHEAEPAREDAVHFLIALCHAPQRAFASAGAGRDVRLAGYGIAGAALVDADTVLHLLAFPTRVAG